MVLRVGDQFLIRAYQAEVAQIILVMEFEFSQRTLLELITSV